MKILVTGGLGFIGSHTAVELVKNGHNIKDAILKVAACWDDEAYYSIDLIIDKLVEEVLRRKNKNGNENWRSECSRKN